MLERALHAPSNFRCGAPTWFGADGTKHRFDYVALPAAWAARVSAVGMMPPSTLALEGRLDHAAPFVTVHLPEVQPLGVG